MFDLFFKSDGRIDQKKFIIGFAGLSIFIFAVNSLLRWMTQSSGSTMLSFWIALIFPFVALYMIYCVYGKRLSDMGRSKGLVFVMFGLEVVAVLIVMIAFGAGEYVAEFSGYDRKDDIDPIVLQAATERYHAAIRSNMMIIRPLLMGIPILFTIWLAVAKPKSD